MVFPSDVFCILFALSVLALFWYIQKDEPSSELDPFSNHDTNKNEKGTGVPHNHDDRGSWWRWVCGPEHGNAPRQEARVTDV